jgi:hypothetical protein
MPNARTFWEIVLATEKARNSAGPSWHDGLVYENDLCLLDFLPAGLAPVLKRRVIAISRLIL